MKCFPRLEGCWENQLSLAAGARIEIFVARFFLFSFEMPPCKRRRELKHRRYCEKKDLLLYREIHPRVCGEYSFILAMQDTSTGSSPCVRGILAMMQALA